VIVDHGRMLAADSLDALLRRLPARCAVEIGLDAPADLDALRLLPGVQGAEALPDGVRVALASLDGTAAVLTALATQDRSVQRLTSAQASLEDVFLALTGRQLRD
jgi:ABC-2 type transport system ATP-binding protein